MVFASISGSAPCPLPRRCLANFQQSLAPFHPMKEEPLQLIQWRSLNTVQENVVKISLPSLFLCLLTNKAKNNYSSPSRHKPSHFLHPLSPTLHTPQDHHGGHWYKKCDNLSQQCHPTEEVATAPEEEAIVWELHSVQGSWNSGLGFLLTRWLRAQWPRLQACCLCTVSDHAQAGSPLVFVCFIYF